MNWRELVHACIISHHRVVVYGAKLFFGYLWVIMRGMEKRAKYIHYCWFGGKKLSKLAKRCIRSWEKYLPDYKIIRWDESNVDLDECPFIREAYSEKKWAFVADYVRTKVLYEYGGIYFDTDMMIVKDIGFLLDKQSFIGIDDQIGRASCRERV